MKKVCFIRDDLIAYKRSGLAEGRRINSSFGPRRTINIILLTGEANKYQVFGSHIVAGNSSL
jgi:hypothetical protein